VYGNVALVGWYAGPHSTAAQPGDDPAQTFGLKSVVGILFREPRRRRSHSAERHGGRDENRKSYGASCG
jgi:hypothetical protein